jgi:hypothetical protein
VAQWVHINYPRHKIKIKIAKIAFLAVLRIQIRKIHIFLGFPDPDPLLRVTDPDPSIIKHKLKTLIPTVL